MNTPHKTKQNEVPSNRTSDPPPKNGAHVYLPGEAEVRWMGETSTRFLAMGEQTAGAFSLVDETARRGETVPLHRHRGDMESWYVLDGAIAFYIEGRPPVVAGPGTFVHVSAGTVHGFRIESESARYLILTTPRHGNFYRAITNRTRPGGLPPEELVTGEQMRRACEEFGVEMVGPLPGAT